MPSAAVTGGSDSRPAPPTAGAHSLQSQSAARTGCGRFQTRKLGPSCLQVMAAPALPVPATRGTLPGLHVTLTEGGGGSCQVTPSLDSDAHLTVGGGCTCCETPSPNSLGLARWSSCGELQEAKQSLYLSLRPIHNKHTRTRGSGCSPHNSGHRIPCGVHH